MCRVVEVRVSLNGIDYVPNSVFIRINDCTVSYTHTHIQAHTHKQIQVIMAKLMIKFLMV